MRPHRKVCDDMKNRTGVIDIDDLRQQVPQNKVRGFTMRSTKPKSGEDWFRIVKNAYKVDGEDVTEVYIYDEIGFWGTDADSFARLLMQIDSSKIDLHVNSPGGEFFDGVAIYNALKMHNADVTVYVDGLAASAASFIAQAGDRIVMGEGSMMMIHDAAGITFGNAADHAKSADILDKVSTIVAELYAARAGESPAFWRALMLEETWYNAQEAVDAKLADEVGGGEGNQPKNAWDLTIFNYAGRDKAPSPEQVKERVIANRAKEAPLSTKAVKNSESTPEAPATPAEGTEEEVPAVEPDVPEAPVEEPEAPVEEAVVEGTQSVAVQNRASDAQVFVINGRQVTDATEVQRYIQNLETFQKETSEANRRAFVAQLASDGKILASKLTEVEAYALGLAPENYESWAATWDAVPASSVLNRMPVVDPVQGGPTATSSVNEIDDLKAIVKNHKQGGMPEGQIKNTGSYKKLIELDPNFDLAKL